MKFTFLAVLLLCLASSYAQQALPNGGFESWSSPYSPTSWTTFEDVVPPIAGVGLSAKDSVDKYEGSASVVLTSKYVALADDTAAGSLSLGTGTFAGGSPKLFGAPFTSSPDTLTFAYKYAPVANDSAGFYIQLKKAGANKLALGGNLLGTGGQWQVVTIALKQFYTDTAGLADTLKLQFFSSYLSSSRKPPVGSVLKVDAVRLGYKTAPTFIENINNNISVDVYPNPANKYVNVRVSESISNASIVVYDMTGRVVTHEFGGSNNFELSIANWEQGLYTYSILSGGVVVTKGRFAVQK